MLRGTGARGLRAIMEEVLLSVMYEVPSNPNAARVLITREVVLENVNPTIVPREFNVAPGRPAASRPRGEVGLRPMRVAVCQLNARDDRAANLKVARDLLDRAAALGADLAVLPEYIDYLGPRRRACRSRSRSTASSATFFAAAARELGIWVLAGSFHEAGPDAARTYNTLAGLRPHRRAGRHLPQDPPVRRRDPRPGVLPGVARRSRPAPTLVSVDVEGVRVGLSICYDLRFPELYRRLADRRRARSWSCRRRS